MASATVMGAWTDAQNAYVAASFTEAAAIMLSRTWRLEMVANNANAVTYSISVELGV